MSKRLQELVARYESMRSGGESHYFDSDEIIEIAEYYEANDALEKALPVVELGLKLHPDSDMLRLKQVRYWFFLDKIEEAKNLLATIVDKGVEVTLIRANLLYFENHIEEGHRLLLSLLDYKEVCEEDCYEALEIYISYSHFEGMKEFVACAEKRLPDSRILLREMAAIYEEKGDLDAAVAIYNRLLDRDPYSSMDWFSLAQVEAKAKCYDRALEACDFALAIQESDESVILFKGYCYYDSGQYAQAIEQFLLVKYIINECDIYALIGECYVKLEEPNRALEYFGKALALSPDNPNLHYQMATCHYDLGNTPQAVMALKETLRINEQDDEAHSFLGEILLHQGDYKEAYYHLSRSLEINPDDEETLRFLCDACIQLDRFNEAIPMLEVILLDSPYDLNARFNLVVAYAHEGEIERAEELITWIETHEQDSARFTDEERQQWSKAQEMLQSLKKLLLDELGENK